MEYKLIYNHPFKELVWIVRKQMERDREYIKIFQELIGIYHYQECVDLMLTKYKYDDV